MAAHPHLVHLDDVEAVRTDKAPLQGWRKRLGPEVGAREVGLSHYRLGPGERIMPVHVHADEEELFYVAGGTGFCWQDGLSLPVAAGDLLVHLGNAEAHTMVAGDEGLQYLAFGEGSRTNMTWLPRAGAWWMGPRWLPADGPNPFKAEVLAGPLDLDDPTAERPSTIVHRDAVPAERIEQPGYVGTDQGLGDAAGSVHTGASLYVLDPGQASCPAHWHTAQEELFVVLAGTGVLELGEERLDVRPGHVVGRPPRTGVAHRFVAGADASLELLAFGTRVPADVCHYPRSGKLSIGGTVLRVVEAGYWDGE